MVSRDPAPREAQSPVVDSPQASQRRHLPVPRMPRGCPPVRSGDFTVVEEEQIS